MESHKSAWKAAAVQIKESGEGGMDYVCGNETLLLFTVYLQLGCRWVGSEDTIPEGHALLCRVN